jgi:hypothetical protein
MKNTREQFLEQLEAAFPAEPIRSAGAFVPWGATYPDAAPYMQQLDGKTWRELDRAYLARRSDALGFLGTPHLVTVLPVYLRSLVEDGVWSPAAGMLMVVLTKAGPGTDAGLGTARFDELVAALTDAQRAMVASGLEAFAESDPDGSLGRAATAALDSHWKTYLPAKESV